LDRNPESVHVVEQKIPAPYVSGSLIERPRPIEHTLHHQEKKKKKKKRKNKKKLKKKKKR